MQTDFLIVGQGLAGSLLAWELVRRDFTVVVIDSGKANASSVAAGIINPVTGIRLALTSDVETMLPAALTFYDQLAEFFGQRFYHSFTMLRLFRNESELAYGNQRLTQKDYLPYLNKLVKVGQFIPGFTTPFGWLEQKQTGFLSTQALLNRLKLWLIEQGAYRQNNLDYRAIHFNHTVSWQDINAKHIIFCEGYLVNQNPWFSWLPMQPAKGEILTLESEQEVPDAIINYGNWLIPSTPGTLRVGATFDREYINDEVTEQGKQTLLHGLATFSPRLAQSTISAHEVGIRPCTIDRKPFIGTHPQQNQITIFNGFGSKGSLQIPWYCQHFADYLQHNTPLPAFCDIRRYRATHFPG